MQPPSPEVLSLQLEMYCIATSHRKRWIPLSSSAVCWPLMCFRASRPGTRSLFWKPFQHHVVLPRDIQHSSPQPFHSLHGVFQFAQSVGDVSLIHPLISVTAHFAFFDYTFSSCSTQPQHALDTPARAMILPEEQSYYKSGLEM